MSVIFIHNIPHSGPPPDDDTMEIKTAAPAPPAMAVPSDAPHGGKAKHAITAAIPTASINDGGIVGIGSGIGLGSSTGHVGLHFAAKMPRHLAKALSKSGISLSLCLPFGKSGSGLSISNFRWSIIVYSSAALFSSSVPHVSVALHRVLNGGCHGPSSFLLPDIAAPNDGSRPNGSNPFI